MYVLVNRQTNAFARYDSTGEHDGKTTDDVSVAREFGSYGEASEYGQNFGPDWTVESACGGHDSEPFFGNAAINEIPAW